MNFLFCSVGRRVELIKDFRKTLSPTDRIIATDISILAPAIYYADKYYIVPPIAAPDYIQVLLEICRKESIRAVTTLIDPEISILSSNRDIFFNAGVEVLAPTQKTAQLCFDKYQMYLFLKEHNIPTAITYHSYLDFEAHHEKDNVDFPVFIKPRTGSGSVGARKIYSDVELRRACLEDTSLIIQQFMDGIDLDADVYVDTISHQAVSAFSKKKLETKIGGASKTISFKDPKLFDLICKITNILAFSGPIDIDFFYKDGVYYLSEINPRFGGAYLHAYGAGIDFIKLIINNLNGIQNQPVFGNYDEGVAMLMYDSVVICKPNEIEANENSNIDQ